MAHELWGECTSCREWIPLHGASGEGVCSCGAQVLYAKQGSGPADAAAPQRASAADIWVACDICNAWRELTSRQAAALQPGAAWQCSRLFPGASCSLPDDWDRALGSSKRRRHAQREAAAESQAAQQRRERCAAQRAQRAEERTAGIPAAQRYTAGAVVAAAECVIHADPSASEGLDDVANDPQYRPKLKRQRPLRRTFGAAEAVDGRVPLSQERDAWEECGACQLWVNLGRPRAGPCGAELTVPAGACPGCGGRVEWCGYRDIQEWIQCDDCGRWRTGLAETVLREIEAAGAEAKWTCGQLRAGATCRSSANDWGRAVRAQAARRVREERGATGVAQLATRFVQLPETTTPQPYAVATLAAQVPPPAGLAMAALQLWMQQHQQPGTGAPFAAERAGLELPSAWVELATAAFPPAQPAVLCPPAPPASRRVVATWHCRRLPPSSLFSEFVPGRDELFPAEQLAAGLDAYDAGGGEHVLSTALLPRAAFALASPLVLAGLRMFQGKLLPECAEGRCSAGPVDLAAYLAQPGVREQVRRALHRRRVWLQAAGRPVPRDPHMLQHVVHVSPDARKVYVGDERDLTKRGGSIMNFNKSWRSLPIQSWSGGKKMADMAGARANQLVSSKLSALLAPQEAGLVGAAEVLWAQFAALPATAAAALRMLAHLDGDPVRSASRLGATGWNAYSFNVDYRTARHLDGKNCPGSYSALVVFESGEPFVGCHYMLPQYRTALDLRQGVVLYHRSGDAHVGLHANSALHRPAADSHRLALVLYQTEIKAGAGPGGEAQGWRGEEEDEGEELDSA